MLKLLYIMMIVWAVDAVMPVASAQEHRVAGARVLPAPERRGCYWYRQRLFCSRYCYTEINGHRYCRDHEREAVPQAPL